MRRSFICGLCLMAAAVLYVLTRTGAALTLLCAAVLFPVVSIILGTVSSRSINVYLTIPASVHKKTPTRCALVIENRSRIPAARAELILYVKNALTGGEEALGPLAASALTKGKTELEFTFETEHCGQFAFSADALYVYDFLCLRAIRRTVTIREKRVVPPDMFPLDVTLSGGDVLSGTGEVISVPKKGQDKTEPFQIRDYAEGDSPKQIHWRLTKKYGRYIVTDPSLELEHALLIVWDSGQLGANAPPELPDALAEAAVSLCVELGENGIPYSVIWKNGETGEIMLKDVGEKDDVFDVATGLLGADGLSGVSLVPEFLKLLDGKRYPLIAYFSYSQPEELAELESTGKVTAFVCGYEDISVEGKAVAFTPDNYERVLREITI